MRWIFTSGGRMVEALIRSISASTRWSVGRLWPPRLISTMPSTMSPCPSCPTMPSRGALETRTSATSRTSTGVPLTWVSMVSRMSSMSRIRPTPRTTADCSPTFKVWPPTLMEELFSALTSWTRVMPWAWSRFRSTATSYSLVLPPKAVTSTTPGIALNRRCSTQSCRVFMSAEE
ncbi:hypothetical protein MPOCJGCO_4492 [Methylobacterium trifolii]|uniref:Uncharacterized protein n=1 Tax=Methylobacterium trifolii TaxID=1003092 RepID=A0ABQ4U600_9HYPH|nr:hypothetical protein MPOCJGCO_4492 [Methylobacterium trifolii]